MPSSGIAAAAAVAAVCLALLTPAADPAAAQGSPFGNLGGAPVPGHDTHNRAPDAPSAALTWEELFDLDVTVETPAPLQTVFHVSFPESLRARDGRTVSIRGFMYPLEAGETHDYFLLSAYPPSCPFCLPSGARGLVEVKCRERVRYTLEPVLVEGRFELLEDDDTGLYFRLNEARAAG